MYNLFLVINLAIAIPFINDEFTEIKLYDYRDISYNEYEIMTTNLETNDFIDYISPFPLSINNDIYCEDINNNYLEVMLISCHSWNKLKFYNLKEHYNNCYIKRNIELFGNIFEFVESIKNKC